MLQHYSSPFRNFVHQLFITPSKHLYVLKDGRLKWQDKAMDVALEKIEASERVHVVHYVVADHTSSAFYAEMHTSKALTSPQDFLTRAWSTKPDFFFRGIPQNIIVPTLVLQRFPELNGFLDQLEVGNVPPTSGFQAGIHQVRNWEKDIAMALSFHTYLEKTPCTMANLAPGLSRLLIQANDRQINRPGIRMTRKQLWEMPVDDQPALRTMILNGP
jgi:hypothetical protein